MQWERGCIAVTERLNRYLKAPKHLLTSYTVGVKDQENYEKAKESQRGRARRRSEKDEVISTDKVSLCAHRM